MDVFLLLAKRDIPCGIWNRNLYTSKMDVAPYKVSGTKLDHNF